MRCSPSSRHCARSKTPARSSSSDCPEADSAERVAHAAVDGGFRALEITPSIPGAR